MKLTLIQVFVFRFMLRSDVNMLQVQRNYISLDHVRFLETERYSLMRLHMPLNALRATSTKVENVAKNTSGVLLRRYSGFNFSHYDLPFPTRYCIPFVRSGLYQFVIRVKGFRVSAHDLDSHCIIRFCPSAWTPRFQRVELCTASARTTLAVSAVAPS